MQAQVAFARGVHDGAELLERPDPAAGAVVGVLEGDRRHRRVVVIVRRQRRGDLVGREHAGTADGEDLHAGQRGGAAGFVAQQVAAGAGQHHVAVAGERADRRLIGHRAARHEQCRRHAEALRGDRLQAVDGRILAVDVVADLGRGHRRAHRRGRAGDGVAPQVDGLH